MSDHTAAFVPACLAKFGDADELRGIPVEQREVVVAALFDAMHEWSMTRLPFGSTAAISEGFIRKGIRAAQQKVKASPPAGIDPLTVLTICSLLFSVVKWLVDWWRNRDA